MDVSTALPADRRASAPLALALREAANKLEAYGRVRASRRPPPTPPERWGELVEAGLAGPPWPALFRLERLGQHLAATAWRVSGGRPRGLFTDPRRPALPERGLIPLHVGMGLAFADGLLGSLPRGGAPADLAGLLARLLACCRDNARAPYLAAAWETLGVYVQLFRPRWTAAAGARLAALDREAAGCFWHGAGRGAYFLPRHLLPGATARAVALCRSQPADEEGRADALSGLLFAAAMVNLRHPPVFETMLERVAAAAGSGTLIPAAVAAAVLVRREVTPQDPAIPALLAHHAMRAERWRRWVSEPVLRALADEAPLRLAVRQLTGTARHRPPAAMGTAFARRAHLFGNMAAACVPSAASGTSPSPQATTSS